MLWDSVSTEISSKYDKSSLKPQRIVNENRKVLSELHINFHGNLTGLAKGKQWVQYKCHQH